MDEDHVPGLRGDVHLQQPVDRGGVPACQLREPLGGPARGGGQEGFEAHLLKEVQNALQGGGLAGAGATGDEQQLFRGRGADGLPLLGGVFDVLVVLHPGHGPGQVGRQTHPTPRHLGKAAGQIAFGPAVFGQIDRHEGGHGVQDDPLLLRQPPQPFPDDFPVQAQKGRRGVHQLGLGDKDVAAGAVKAQFIQDPRVHPALVVAVKAQLQGEGVHLGEGGVEAFLRQEIGVVLDRHHGKLAVGLVDPDGQLGGQVVTAEELRQMPKPLLGLEALMDLPGLGGGDAGHLGQPVRIGLDDLQAFGSEAFHDPGGQLGSDAPDSVGRQIGQDLNAGLGHEAFQSGDLQLFAVGAVGTPPPLDPQPLAHLGLRYGADDGGRLALLVLQPQDGVAVFRILKDHGGHAALDPDQFVFHALLLFS